MTMLAPEIRIAGGTPDRIIMAVSGLDEQEARTLAKDAVFRARMRMPRVTGRTASRLEPVYGPNYFGVWFPDSHTWFLEQGTGPRTMRSLAGKTIPMWIDDYDGSMRSKNPKARVRVTEDGRTQVLIFRRAAPIGAKKKVTSKWGVSYMAPASYPGAPGKISRRTPGAPWTPASQRAGAISAGNTGVRWRHPGIRAMQFINAGIAEAAFDAGLIVEPVYAVDASGWELVRATRKQAR